MLGVRRSGLAASDLAPLVEALDVDSKRLKALAVLRGLNTHHNEVVRTLMSPIVRCLHDADAEVRRMALRVMAGARVKELKECDLLVVADHLLHADVNIRREAVAVFDSVKDTTVGLLAPWLVMQLLRVPEHDYTVVMNLKHLLTRVPGARMPAHVEALLSALECGCASVQATAVDTLMALKGSLLEPVLPRMEALISQHDAPGALRGHLLRVALRVYCTEQTSTLADAVVAGMCAEEHVEVQEACVAAIEILRYELLHQRARCVMSGLLTVQPLRLVESGATRLLKRAAARSDGTLVEAHLGTVLEALWVNADGTSCRAEAAFVIAKTFSCLCVRSHEGLLRPLLQHADINIRRKAFSLMAPAYRSLCGLDQKVRFGHRRLQAPPPLIDEVAHVLSDPDETVRACAQDAMFNALVYLPLRCVLSRQEILAALLEYGHTWDGTRVCSYVRAVGPKLQETLQEGDDVLRLKILKLLEPIMCYEIQEDLLKALKRIKGEGSLSTRLIATKLLRHVPPKHQEVFDDGYVPFDFSESEEDDDADEYWDDDF